jgi:FdhD protein
VNPEERARARASRRRGKSTLRRVTRFRVEGDASGVTVRRDSLATEEPLEIRLRNDSGQTVPISVTMRTPGSDFELAAGFLYGEGLIAGGSIRSVRYCVDAESEAQQYNAVVVELAPNAQLDPERFRRHFYTSSSCGVCGKASIAAVLGPVCEPVPSRLLLEPELLLRLPERFRAAQQIFERTGGLHAAALFTADGTLLDLREDVGRHNAMDKLIGAAVLRGAVPLGPRVLLVSGRLSFELVQKAARAGVELLAGVSAPSSLAVELAEEAGVTLVGFLRENGFNVYSAPERIALSAASPSIGPSLPKGTRG